MTTPILRIEKVTRRFPGVTALDDVSLDVFRGEVHAVVGENGAGKSTLINILSGVFPPDAGRLVLDGRPVDLANPVAARRSGVVAVHQEAELFGALSVAENMALGVGLPTTRWGFVRWREVHRRARSAVAPLSADLDVRRPASRLSVAERHLSQIAAAVVENARVVLLDEPSSVLTAGETDWLFGQVERLRRAGAGIIYISHRQEEIFRLADRISVLRDGRIVWSGPAGDIDPDRLVSAMVGRNVSLSSSRRRGRPPSGVPRLRVVDAADAVGRFHGVSFEVSAGEIFGVYGLVGSGRSELAQGIFGLRRLSAGRVEVDGRILSGRSPARAVQAGLAYLPEDRLRQSICRGLSVLDNVVLASLKRLGRPPFVNRRLERAAAQRQVEEFRVRLHSLDAPVEQLSGGNQQKVVFARWVLTNPKVLILDEPTRGVDVAAKVEIHALIRRLADQGVAVVLISSELPEVLAHSDRIGIFREGRLVSILDGESATAVSAASLALPRTAAADQADGRKTRPTSRPPIAFRIAHLGLVAAVVLLSAVLAFSTDGRFLTSANLANLVNNLSSRAILAFAAATVIIAGGIDISIGSLFALAAAVGGVAMKSAGGGGVAVAAGIFAGCVVGGLGGAFNAGASLLGRVHPIVVTLGTMTIFRGLLSIVTGGNVLAGLPDAFGALATRSWFGLQGAAWVLIATSLAVHVGLSHTIWGRRIYAVGANPTAAKLVGISRSRTWLSAYAFGGLLVGLAGMLELAQNRTMQTTMGAGYELKAIAAAVVGGAAVQGGRGGAPGVLLGALLLAMIENGLVLWEVSGARYDLVVGGLLLTAVLLDALTRRVEP
jgi:ABC-type sugar transport system ATPase subunit/ribose/xylose/arabinose/galactoside ABC-type transport system permease subunit